MSQSRQRGFTLIEFMIVVAILAILTALAVPTISGTMGDSRLRDAMNEVRFFLAEARARATERNVAVVVVIDRGAPLGGDFALWEGTSRDCSTVDTSTPALLGPYVMGTDLRFRETGLSSISMGGTDQGASIDLCIRPDGGVYLRPAVTPITGPLQFRFRRYEAASPVGVERILRLNFNGIPRIER
jgi:prepilin-type N-terminal cleavage/methylation domain-containing protein